MFTEKLLKRETVRVTESLNSGITEICRIYEITRRHDAIRWLLEDAVEHFLSEPAKQIRDQYRRRLARVSSVVSDGQRRSA